MLSVVIWTTQRDTPLAPSRRDRRGPARDHHVPPAPQLRLVEDDDPRRGAPRHAHRLLHRGLFRRRAHHDRVGQRAMAATSSPAAGLLSHALVPLALRRRPAPQPPAGRHRHRRPARPRRADPCTARRRRRPPDASHGIPCTRPERMVIDCAPDLTSTATSAASSTTSRSSSLATFRSLSDAVRSDAAAGTLRALRELLGDGPPRRHPLPARGPPARAQRRTRPARTRPQRHRRRLRGRLLLLRRRESSSRPTATTSTARRSPSRTTAEKWLALEASGRRVLPVSYRQVTELRERTGRRARGDHPQAGRRSAAARRPRPATSPAGTPVYGSVPGGERLSRRTVGTVLALRRSRRRRRRRPAQYT